MGVMVASFTDAWIETEQKSKLISEINVASFTDAWIETYSELVEAWTLGRIFYRCVD